MTWRKDDHTFFSSSSFSLLLVRFLWILLCSTAYITTTSSPFLLLENFIFVSFVEFVEAPNFIFCALIVSSIMKRKGFEELDDQNRPIDRLPFDLLAHIFALLTCFKDLAQLISASFVLFFISPFFFLSIWSLCLFVVLFFLYLL